MIRFLFMAMAVACVSTTLSQALIFKPLRNWLGWKVLKCGYCLNHWLALACLAFASLLCYTPLSGCWLLEWLALTTASSIFGLFLTIYLLALEESHVP